MENELRQKLEAYRQEAAQLSGSPLTLFRARHTDLLREGATHLLCRESPELSARRQLGRSQSMALLGLLLLVVALTLLAPVRTLVTLNAVFIAYCLGIAGLRYFLLSHLLKEGRPRYVPQGERLTDDELPIATVICPLYKEERSLPNLIGALEALDYPADKLDIKIVLEADDEVTRKLAVSLCKPGRFEVIVVPDGQPRTKPRACNYALWNARGDLTVIYDAEDRPATDQLRRAAEAFRRLPPEVACLQARLNYYNRRQGWLTRIFAAEYAYIFDVLLPGLTRLRAPLPLGGTSNIFRTEALMAVGGWDPFNVTEDADIGMRLSAMGYHCRMLDATTLEEATGGLMPWFRQRTRWIKGYMQTLAVHSRRAPRNWQEALTLYFVIGGVVVAALLNPLFWGLYLLWISGVADLGWLFPGPLGFLATIAFLVGNLILLWLYMLAPMRRRWHDLVPYTLTAPVYWVLQSVAGYRAAWQFITRPHYWEKTEHGEGVRLEDIAEPDLKAAS